MGVKYLKVSEYLGGTGWVKGTKGARGVSNTEVLRRCVFTASGIYDDLGVRSRSQPIIMPGFNRGRLA